MPIIGIGGALSGSGGGTVDSSARTAASAARTVANANKAVLDTLQPTAIDTANITNDDAAKTITFPLNDGSTKVVDIAGMFAGLSGVAETAAQTTYDNATSAIAAVNVQDAIDEINTAYKAADAAIKAMLSNNSAPSAASIVKLPIFGEPDRENGQMFRSENIIQILTDDMNADFGYNGECFAPTPLDDGNQAIDTPESFVTVQLGSIVNWTLEDNYGGRFSTGSSGALVDLISLVPGIIYGVRYELASTRWIYRKIVSPWG